MKRGLFLLIVWTLILLSVLLAPIGNIDIPVLEGFRYRDKVVHFILFLITGLISVWATRFFSKFSARIVFGSLFSLLLAFCIETGQLLLPYRDMSVYDLIADIAGLVFGMGLSAFIYNINAARSLFRL